jgi:hypothetical protein
LSAGVPDGEASSGLVPGKQVCPVRLPEAALSGEDRVFVRGHPQNPYRRRPSAVTPTGQAAQLVRVTGTGRISCHGRVGAEDDECTGDAIVAARASRPVGPLKVMQEGHEVPVSKPVWQATSKTRMSSFPDTQNYTSNIAENTVLSENLGPAPEFLQYQLESHAITRTEGYGILRNVPNLRKQSPVRPTSAATSR